MCPAFGVRYIPSERGAIFLLSSRELSFAVFYVWHLCIALSKFTAMRVLFPLVALVVGAQALSSSLYQKRGGTDMCCNIGSPVALTNPLTGKSMTFGNLGEIILVDPFYLLSDNSAEHVLSLSVDECTCLSGIPSLIKSNSVLSAASLVVGSSKVTDFVTSKVSQPPFFAPPVFRSIGLLSPRCLT